MIRWLVLGLLSAAEVPVALSVDPCVDVPAIELRRVLAIELGRPLHPGLDADPSALRARAQCVGSMIELTIEDAAGTLIATQQLDLQSVAVNGRARLLALAIAELLEPSDRGAPQAPPVASVAEVPVPEPSATAPRRLSASAGALSFFGLPPRAAWVAGVDFTQRLLAPFELGVGLGAHGTRATTELGVATLTAVSVSATLGAAKSVFSDDVRFAVGVGGRAGVALLEGWPSAPDVQAGTMLAPWGGPMVSATGDYAPFAHLGFTLGLEAGWAIGGVLGRVQGVTELGLSGAWLAGKAGVVVSW